MKEVKVVILNWNGRAHLQTFLPSVVENTPAEVGIAVADNGSEDDSVEWLKAAYPSVGILRMDRNYGFAEGYNRALHQIDSEFCILLNSDVETPAGWCEPLVELIRSDERIAAVAPKILSYSDKRHFEYAGASGGFIDMFGYPFCRGRILSTIEEDRGQYDTPREVFWASGACMLVRSSLFHLLGGFDAKFFAHMEEIDFCWRAQLYGYKVMVEPAAKVYHLGGGTLPNNTERKIYLNYRNNLAMLFKNLSGGNVELVLFSRMILDGASALVFLLQGRFDFFKAVFRAHIDYCKWRRELRLQRRKIQGEAVQKSQNIYRGFIIMRYVLKKRRFGNMM